MSEERMLAQPADSTTARTRADVALMVRLPVRSRSGGKCSAHGRALVPLKLAGGPRHGARKPLTRRTALRSRRRRQYRAMGARHCDAESREQHPGVGDNVVARA